MAIVYFESSAHLLHFGSYWNIPNFALKTLLSKICAVWPNQQIVKFNGFYHPSNDNSDMSHFHFYLTFYSITASIKILTEKQQNLVVPVI